MPAPVTPADVLAHLARRGDAATARVTPRGVPAGPSGDRDAVLTGISASYFRLRRGLAAITLAWPPLLWLGAGGGRLQGSISAYYHAPGTVAGGGAMRDVFVGVLWTIGAFLFFYRGYSRAEDRALNLAGVAAVVVSLCPMDWPPGSAVTLTGRVHAGSAIVFFLAIAYVAVVRSGDTLALLDATRRRVFTRVYRVLGVLMIALPLGVVGLHAALGPAPHSIATWATEVSGITVFAVFWLVKSREIALIERGT